MFSRAAIETGAVRIFADGERATDFFMPAAEEFAEQADFLAERLVGSISESFRRSISF